jgi:hypothetical protein
LIEQPLYIEVDEEPYLAARETQARNELRRVHRFQPLDRFDLDDDQSFDKDVYSVPAVKVVALVDQRQRFLLTN